MTDLPQSEPSFDDEEVALILRRAAELQHEEPLDGERRGFSLAELERIAEEAGIDPRHLRRAVTDLQLRGKAPGKAAYDEETKTVRFERTVRKEIPETELEALAETVRQALDRRGSTRLLHRDFVWRSESSSLAERFFESLWKATRNVNVTLSRREGQTSIRIEERLQRQANETLLLSMSLTGGLCVFLTTVGMARFGPVAALVSLAVSAVLMAGSFVLGRRVFRATVRGRSRELLSLLERLEEQIAEVPVARKELPPKRDEPPGDSQRQ